MGWKFVGRIRYGQLSSLKAFKLVEDVYPESLGRGRFRVTIVEPNEKRYLLTTFESTLGDMVNAGGLKDWIRAVEVSVDDKMYLNFEKVSAARVSERQ